MKFTFPAMLLCMVTSHAISQCVSPVTPPVIACGTGTPLTSGVSINAGQTYQYNGTGGSFSNITINGGTLLLCGTATITNLNYNSGQMVINPGADITFGGAFNAGTNRQTFNYGTATFNTNAAISGANTLVFNAAGASIDYNGNLAVFNNGLFINNGTAAAFDVIINSGAQLCFGPNSYASLLNITNNQTNGVTVPTGVACVSYSGSFTGNNPITATPNLRVCQQPGASAPLPAVIGASTVISNCTNCPTLLGTLPLTLSSFKGRRVNEQVELEWTTAWEEGVQAFQIEKSSSGQAYEKVGELTANNRPSTYKYFTALQGDGYFRLKMLDLDGRFTYSSVVKITSQAKGLQVTILSNPVRQSFADVSIQVAQAQTGELLLIDSQGKPRKRMALSLTRGTNNIRLDLNGITAGQYYLSFQGKLDKSGPAPLLKL